MVWPFRRALTEDQAALLRRRCSAKASALRACEKANAGRGTPAACRPLADDAALCQAGVVCPDAARAFAACVDASEAALRGGRSRVDCATQAAAVARCLRGFALPPP